jgi:hypothetical protein
MTGKGSAKPDYGVRRRAPAIPGEYLKSCTNGRGVPDEGSNETSAHAAITREAA